MNPTSPSIAELADRHAGRLMVLPADMIILAFALFPLIISAYLSVTRFALAPGGFKLTFIGLLNYRKLLVGAQQYHFLGTFQSLGAIAWIFLGLVTAALLFWFGRSLVNGGITVAGAIGRLVSTALAFGLALLVAATILSDDFPGTFVTTFFYVIVGVAIQFLLGLGLALLVARPIYGRSFFRVAFFVPLMVTPVGIAYTFRMLADMQKGPFAPISRLFGLGEWAWATEPWSARLIVLLGDTWQWTPFMFIVLLAAVENQPR